MSHESSAHNQRRLQRHCLSVVVDVFDAEERLPLGKLVNIHQKGLMLVSQKPLVADQVYALQLRLPDKIDGDRSLFLQADCLWSRTEEGASTCWSGWQIVEISSQATERIAHIIRAWGEPAA